MRLILWSFVIFLLAACGANNEEKAPVVNSAIKQKSELAILMRTMHDTLKYYQKEVAAGARPDIDFHSFFSKIQTATPTDSSDSGPKFQAFATYYLNELNTWQLSPDSSNVDHYNMMVEACVICHQEYCFGPIPMINRLKVSEVAQ